MKTAHTADRHRLDLVAGLSQVLSSYARSLGDAVRQRRRDKLQLLALRGLDAQQRDDIGMPPLPEVEFLILDARAKMLADLLRRLPDGRTGDARPWR